MTTLAGKRVLLAEDDEAARRLLARCLREMDLDVIEVGDGGRMLVEITSQYKGGRSPQDLSLIVTDVRMPIMTGIDAFKGIRAAHWRTPVIIVTAYETSEVRDVVERFGATLLIKPIDLDEFEAQVRRALTTARILRPLR
jgi:two-component system response regulator AtoC